MSCAHTNEKNILKQLLEERVELCSEGGWFFFRNDVIDFNLSALEPIVVQLSIHDSFLSELNSEPIYITVLDGRIDSGRLVYDLKWNAPSVEDLLGMDCEIDGQPKGSGL